MKLSIIVPAYKTKKALEKYLEKICEINSKSIEVIFVIDKDREKTLSLINNSYLKKLNNMKVIYNTKRIGRNAAIFKGSKIATGDYIMIHSLFYSYDFEKIKTLIKETQIRKSDIIEFKPYFSNPIRWKPNIRKKYNKTVLIEEHPDIWAYTYFFLSNKVFKKELFEKSKDILTLSSHSNKHSIELVCKLFISAKTYSNISLSPIKVKKYMSNNYNPLLIIKELKLISTSDIYKKYDEEIEYNKYFCEAIIYLAIVSNSGNKITFKKYLKALSKEYENSDLFNINKYYLSNFSEAKKLRAIKGDFSDKSYKEFNDKK